MQLLKDLSPLFKLKLIDTIIIVMEKEVFKSKRLEVLLFTSLKEKDLETISIMLMENQSRFLLLREMFIFTELMYLDQLILTSMVIHLSTLLLREET